MICPSCNTHIPDGSLRCPACHAPVALTQAMPALQGRWCPSCGVALAWEDEVCPHCGLPLEPAWEKPAPAEAPTPALAPEPLGEDEEADTGEGQDLPHIESAIPAEDDPTSKVALQDAMPKSGRLMLASVASAALIGGLALAITHPWNPDQYSIKATTEADTSMAGFPGTVEALSGQDSSAQDEQDVLSGDEALLAELTEAYEKLGSYAGRADESETLFAEVGYDGTADQREQGRRQAEALAIDVSNLIAHLEQLDAQQGSRAEQRDNLLTLGSWLRNRIDVLVVAWRASADASDPTRIRDELSSLVRSDHDNSGQSAYQKLFDESYGAWEPTA